MVKKTSTGKISQTDRGSHSYLQYCSSQWTCLFHQSTAGYSLPLDLHSRRWRRCSGRPHPGRLQTPLTAPPAGCCSAPPQPPPCLCSQPPLPPQKTLWSGSDPEIALMEPQTPPLGLGRHLFAFWHFSTSGKCSFLFS